LKGVWPYSTPFLVGLLAWGNKRGNDAEVEKSSKRATRPDEADGEERAGKEVLLTQQERILAVLRQVRNGDHEIPAEYIRRHHTGDGISSRYLKRVLWITECNGRISELRSQGYVIETSAEKDAYGFAYHRLVNEGAA